MSSQSSLDPKFVQVFRDWPELRALGESKQPYVERLRDFLDYMATDSAIAGENLRDQGDLTTARAAQGQALAFLFLRVAIFGIEPDDARIKYMTDCLEKGETP